MESGSRRLAPIARPRSRAKGLELIADDVAKRAPLHSLAVFHAAAPESMATLERRLHETDPNVVTVSGRIGPVVGAYSGPGGLGVACLGTG